MSFLDWISDPDVAEGLREIERHLRCSHAEAVTILMLARLGDQIDALGMTEWAAFEAESDDDDSDEDEEPLGL